MGGHRGRGKARPDSSQAIGSSGVRRAKRAGDLRVITSREKVTFTVTPEMPELDALRTAAVESRAAAAELADAASKAARRFASQAAASGLPVRDIGMMLGVSYQRAQQLVQGS